MAPEKGNVPSEEEVVPKEGEGTSSPPQPPSQTGSTQTGSTQTGSISETTPGVVAINSSPPAPEEKPPKPPGWYWRWDSDKAEWVIDPKATDHNSEMANVKGFVWIENPSGGGIWQSLTDRDVNPGPDYIWDGRGWVKVTDRIQPPKEDGDYEWDEGSKRWKVKSKFTNKDNSPGRDYVWDDKAGRWILNDRFYNKTVSLGPEYIWDDKAGRWTLRPEWSNPSLPPGPAGDYVWNEVEKRWYSLKDGSKSPGFDYRWDPNQNRWIRV